MQNTDSPKTFMEVIHEIANRPLVAKPRRHLPPPCRWHGDKRKDTRAQAKVNLRKEIGE